MRKIIAGLVLALAFLIGATAPANAGWDWKPTAPVSVTAGSEPLPSSIYTGNKFWPYAMADICVAVGDTTIPIGVAAQAWNNASAGVALNAEANCVTAGYTPSTRMTIDTYSAADGRCHKITNAYKAAGDTFDRWTGSPANVVGLVNRYYSSCYGSANARAKSTSTIIGAILGLKTLAGSTWASRVMSLTSAVYYPSASTDGPALTDLYAPRFFGWS